MKRSVLVLMAAVLTFAGCKKAVITENVSIKFNETSYSMVVGDVLELSEEVVVKGIDAAPEFSTSDDEVVSIDENGKLTAISAGEANIMATVSDKFARCKVRVKDVGLSDFEIKTSLNILEGSVENITVEYEQENYNPENLQWTFDCPKGEEYIKVEKVDVKTCSFSFVGFVEDLFAIVVVKDMISSTQKSVTIRVTPLVRATSVIIDESLRLPLGAEPTTLTATCTPDNFDAGTLEWSSSDENVVTVEGGVLTVVGKGESVITAVDPLSGVSDECNITVYDPEEEARKVREIILPSTSIDKVQGDEDFQLEVTCKNADGVVLENYSDLVWSSSDEDVVTVTQSGLVSVVFVPSACVDSDTAEITVADRSNPEIKATCTINVVRAEIKVTSIELQPVSCTLKEGESLILESVITPDNADDKSLTYTSSDDAVASVSEEGEIVAKTKGTATITVKNPASGVTAECAVEVVLSKIPVTSVTLNATSKTLTPGGEFTLVASVLPEDATLPEVVWTSSAPDVAAVDNGKVTAVKGGEATITATADGMSAECKVTVAEVTSLTVVGANQLVIGGSVTLTALIEPAAAAIAPVSWSADPVSVATVDKDGIVTGVSKGDVVITATCGSKTATHAMRVAGPDLKGVIISPSILTIEKTETYNLSFVPDPIDAQIDAVSWNVNGTGSSYVSVDQNGLITGLAPGTATVAVLVNNEFSATCQVTVEGIKPTDIQLSPENLTLVTNQEYSSLTYTISPANCDFKDVRWSVAEGGDVISINETTGVVTALKPGTAKVKVTTVEGGLSDECLVTVEAPGIAYIALTTVGNVTEIPDGETLRILAFYLDEDNNTYTPVVKKWKSSNENFATVDSNGLVTAVGNWDEINQNVTITHEADGMTATIDLLIVQAIPRSVTITSVPEGNAMYVGQTHRFTAVVNPAKASQEIYWNYSKDGGNMELGGSSSSFDFTPSAEGTYLIRARSTGDYSGIYSDVTINVSPVEIVSASLNHTSLEMMEGTTASLSVEFNPFNVTYKDVEWTSTDNTVATVSGGVVTAVKSGTATIQATLSNDSVLECPVTVNVDPNAPKVGDFYYLDGTWSTELDAGKTVVGVVFSTNNATLDDEKLMTDHSDCTHGLVLALDETPGAFGTSASENYSVGSQSTSLMTGYSNTAALKAHANSAEFTILNAMNAKTAVSGTSGWYIPSVKELSILHNNITTVNASLAKVTGALQYADSSKNFYYWSSTAYSTSDRVLIYFYRGGNLVGSNQGEWKSTYKTYDGTFYSFTHTARYIFAF